MFPFQPPWAIGGGRGGTFPLVLRLGLVASVCLAGVLWRWLAVFQHASAFEAPDPL